MMKSILGIVAVVVLLFAAPRPSQALEEIEIVTPERAKALGLEIRSHPAGPDAVRVELEFETKGELANYSRVALEMHNEGKLHLSATLREDTGKPGRVIVGFAADRTKLNQMTVKVVVQDSARSRVGYVVRLHEFVVSEKTR